MSKTDHRIDNESEMTHVSDDHTYAIIAGTTRAGTTSLFLYLAAHPDVCRSSVKETRFFLDSNYSLPIDYPYEAGLSTYVSLFQNCEGDRPVRLEASPDYLYGPSVSARIAACPLHTKLVFILREPVSRLISWHKFAIQRGMIEDDVTLDQYIDNQASPDALDSVPFYYRTLYQGRYSEYLAPFLADFPPEDVLILFFEEMSATPRVVAEATAGFLGIDPAFYRTCQFEVHNPSVQVKSQELNVRYIHVQARLRRFSRNAPRIRRALKSAGSVVNRLYSRLNVEAIDQPKTSLSAAHADYLRTYYAHEYGKVSQIVRRDAPWRFPPLRTHDP